MTPATADAVQYQSLDPQIEMNSADGSVSADTRIPSTTATLPAFVRETCG